MCDVVYDVRRRGSPGNPRELLARIKAVLRRVNSLPPQRDKLKAKAIRFDRWHLNVGRRELVNSEGVGVPLSTAEFRLLKAFLDHAGMVLTATSSSISPPAARPRPSTEASTIRSADCARRSSSTPRRPY